MRTAAFFSCLLAFISLEAAAQLPQKFSYGRYLTGVEDQLRQGPCETFAAVGAVEAYYNLSYNGWSASNPVNLSEREVYSCGGYYTSGLGKALRYIGDHGVIPRSCFAMPAGQCLPEHSDKGPHGIVYDGDRNCPAEQKNCSQKFRIKAAYRELTTEMTTNNGIKQALLKYGPIAVSFDDGGAIHSSWHAYLLYGWENRGGSTFWLLRDSWPCSATNRRESNVNIAAIYRDHGDTYDAYAITSVTKEKWNGSHWVAESKTVRPYELEQGWQSARILPPANACLNRGQYSVTGLPAGSSVTGWSLRASYEYSNNAHITAGGVLSGSAADATIIATVQHGNGLQENITLPVSVVGVPHKVDKTADMCVTSDQREFTLRLTSRKLPGYSYQHAINFEPSSDGSYYVIGNSTVAYVVSRKTQAIEYTTTVEATKDGNPSCSADLTVNRHIISMPCSYGY